MSFLYPLFLAGIAAIGLPILLHMVRRHTRQRVAFSSLMFLRTTLPRLRNRSRVEHLLLLILRCLALCLLAFAFARPFFNRPAASDPARPGLGRRVVLLVDTSASMRRTGMWEQAVREARSVLEEAGPMDRVCIMAFDQDTRMVSGFDQWDALALGQRARLALEQVSRLSPTWAGTRLGQALIAAAEVLEDAEVNEGQRLVGLRQVVLISDLQQGSHMEALQGYEWPKGTELAVRQVRCPGTTNASMQWVTGPSPDRPSVRVTNSPDATQERFQIHWADSGPAPEPNSSLEVYVPPGRSVMVQAPARVNQPGAGRLVLTGDDHDFDNNLYWAPTLRQEVNVLYIGPDDPNDPKEMLYYLRQALGSTDAQRSHVVWRSGTGSSLPAEEVEAAHLIVVTDPVDQQSSPALRRTIESGHTALLVARSAEAATTLAALTGIAAPGCEEAPSDQGGAGRSDRGYAMLGRTDLRHPLLAPFSDPRYGDFTRIHFWRHRRIDVTACPGARVLAWFDSNDPALFEMAAGKGMVLVLTSGWNPSDSDLALSSKFVPLLYSILDHAGALTGRQSQYCVGDPVPVQPVVGSAVSSLQIRRPDGSSVRVDAGQPFGQTDLPGVYTIESSAGERGFAVNLPAEEGRTSPMPVEDLESLGVSLRPSSDVPVAATAGVPHRNGSVVREGDQKVWRWVLMAALAVLLMEIGLAGKKMKTGLGEQP